MAYIYGAVTNCKVVNGQTRTEYECRLGYQVNSQSIENNTSNITLRLEVRSISSSYYTFGYKQTTTIDGTNFNSKTFDMRSTNTWQVFGEKTITVVHNADGSYSASKSGSFTTTTSSSNGGNYALKSGSASVTVAPATIPRASEPTLSASSVAMGSSVTITTNRKSDSFTHILKYNFGNEAGTIGTGIGASTTWSIPLSLANQIPSATSGTCVITCNTYNGTTLVGTKTVTLTLTVPSTVKPSINSVNISEGNSVVPASWGVYIRGKSALKVAINASGAYGSSIVAYKITGIDSITYNENSFTSAVLQEAKTYKIKVIVTDSRSRTQEAEVQIVCVAYSNPLISVATVTRCNADGSTNAKGTSVKYTFKASVSPVNNKNTYAYKLGYKKSTENYFTYIDIPNNSYILDKTNEVISGVTFSSSSTYVFDFRVYDYFTNTSDTSNSIKSGYKLINFNKSGKGIAFGKFSEKDALEIGMDIYDKNGGLITSNNHYTYTNDNKFNDVTQIIGDKFEAGKVYCITNAPATDGNYIQGGYTHTVLGMETPGRQYGYQLSLTYRDMMFRIKSAGTWGNWLRIPRLDTGGGLTVENNIVANGFIQAKGSLSTTNSILQVTNNGNTASFGSQNASYCHIYNSANIPFYFNRDIQVNGRKVMTMTVLYDNSSGSNGTITLTETSANFNYLEIHCKSNDGVFFCQKVQAPNGKQVSLNMVFSTESATAYLKNRLIQISGTTISNYGSRYTESKLTTATSTSTSNTIYITKVVGIY